MSSAGLYARRNRGDVGQRDILDLERSPSSGGLERSHRRRRNPCTRFLYSELGCAIEMIVAFLVVGLFLGYMILHHQQRKVRPISNQSCLNPATGQ
jgi:hypothetical protein